MLIIRASSTDRALDCAGSLLPVENAFNPHSDEARSGDALHEIMAEHTTRGGADVDRYAQEFDVDLDDLAFLYDRGRKALAALARHLPSPRVEHAMSMILADGVELRGKSDVVSVTEAEEGGLLALAVIDWKSGRVKRQHAGQLRSYGLLWRHQFADTMPRSGFVLGAEAWLRFGELEIRHMTADDLDRHRLALLDQIKASQRTMVQYGPGSACHFCPRKQVCGAHAEWVQGSISALTPVGQNHPVTRETIGALYYRAKALRVALSQYDDVLADMLSEGPVPLGDGKQVRISIEERDRITAAALPVLREQGFTEAEIALCTRVAKTELLNIVGEKSPRGLGKRNKDKVMSALKTAGAVDREPRREKLVEPVPPTQEKKS